MKFCRFCGSTLPTRSTPKFCPKCGKNISLQSRPQSRPPTREQKQKLRQPKPLERKTPNYQPHVDTRQKIRKEEINKRKTKEVEVIDPVIQTSQQAQIVYNQKLESIISRLNEMNKSFVKRDSYQLADHKAIILRLEELNELQNNPLYSSSELEHIVRQSLMDSSEVILRILEFLTSHLSTYDLDRVREKWYQIKEQQIHSELDIERIKSLKEDSDKLEKNFNILAYRLEGSSTKSIERSLIYASYPQVHHYYFNDIKKQIPEYLKKIDESGFFNYYKNEKKILAQIQNFFENPHEHKFAPFELYTAIAYYLDLRNKVNQKINSKRSYIEKRLIDVYEQFKITREKYIEIMDRVLDETPLDVLLMRGKEEENFEFINPEIFLSKTTIPVKRPAKHDLVLRENLELSNLGDFKDLSEISELADLTDFNKLNDIEELRKLSKISE